MSGGCRGLGTQSKHRHYALYDTIQHGRVSNSGRGTGGCVGVSVIGRGTDGCVGVDDGAGGRRGAVGNTGVVVVGPDARGTGQPPR